jgi:sigma-B regulation protein RsbU (phosphoserine phosphatase)
MSTLTDYFDVQAIRQLQDAFSAVARRPILICRPDGTPYIPDYAQAPDWDAVFQSAIESGADVTRMPVVADGQVVAQVRLDHAGAEPPLCEEQGHPSTWLPRLLRLMSSVIGRACENQRLLRSRAEELGTLYRLTTEFSGQRDLQTVLDLVARTVVEVLKAKACSIRLLSENQQELVVKSVANLSRTYLKKGPILVSRSRVDQEALSTGKAVYVRDERSDPRVLYPAQAKREGIVSALCAPMLYRDRPEGVIHVYMAREHEFDWFEVTLLEVIAAQAASAIASARLHEEAVHSANMRRALGTAAEVQRRMIPASPPRVPGFEIGAIYVPSYELSGDFYDFIDLPPGNLGIAICDVAGKGVRASLLMASIRASLRAHAMNVYEMREVMAKVNRDLCADTLSSDFATLFYAVLDHGTRRLTYSNAGHFPPILFRDGQVCYLDEGGALLGIDPQAAYGSESFILRPGDLVLAYTDGLVDATNFSDEPFGRDRVEKSAKAALAQGGGAEMIARAVLWDMRRFAGLQTRMDDLTIIAVKAV